MSCQTLAFCVIRRSFALSIAFLSFGTNFAQAALVIFAVGVHIRNVNWQWRSKRFCTCRYILQELALPVDRPTTGNVLNRASYYWRPVPKATSLK